MSRHARKVSAQRASKNAVAGQSGFGARSIRNHSSVSGWQWPFRTIVDYVAVVRGKGVARTVALFEPLFQTAPANILRVAPISSIKGRLGSMAAVFPDW